MESYAFCRTLSLRGCREAYGAFYRRAGFAHGERLNSSRMAITPSCMTVLPMLCSNRAGFQIPRFLKLLFLSSIAESADILFGLLPS